MTDLPLCQPVPAFSDFPDGELVSRPCSTHLNYFGGGREQDEKFLLAVFDFLTPSDIGLAFRQSHLRASTSNHYEYHERCQSSLFIPKPGSRQSGGNCRHELSRFHRLGCPVADVARWGRSTFGRHRSEERRVGKECRSRWSPDH